MRKGPVTVTISLMLSVALALPTMAVSGGRGGGMGGHGHGGSGGAAFHGSGGFHGGSAGHHGVVGKRPIKFAPGRFFPHPFFRQRFFGFGAFATPVFFGGWSGWPWWYSGWPGYYGPGFDDSWPYNGASSPYAAPASYGGYGGPPASAAPTVYSVNLYNPASPRAAVPAFEPPPVSMGSYGSSASGVVEYPGGRYVLRGDGMSSPYAWVWIPNPPGGPPGTPAAEMGPARYGQVYHWIDSEGVMHVTDRWEAVPQLYRQQAKKNLAS